MYRIISTPQRILSCYPLCSQRPFIKKKINFLAMLGLHCCLGFSLVASEGYFLVVGHGLLIAVSCLVVEHRLEGMWLQHIVSVVSAPRL